MQNHAKDPSGENDPKCSPQKLKPSSDSVCLSHPSGEFSGVALDGPLCVLYMSKDPAILFYTSDFLVGTAFMSNHEVGVYIRILCHMADKGRLTETQIQAICGDLGLTQNLKSKLSKDKEGLFFNKRLEFEVEKRKNYSNSRRNNKLGKKHMINTSKSYDNHMENENRNENKDINIRTMKPKIEEIKSAFKERGFPESEGDKFMAYFESVGWVIGAAKKPMKSWRGAVATWCAKLKDSGVRPKIFQKIDEKPKEPEIILSDEERKNLIKQALPNYVG